MLEQPKGSKMLILPAVAALIQNFSMAIVLTYLGLYGLDILKGTWLVTNMTKLVKLMSNYGWHQQ